MYVCKRVRLCLQTRLPQHVNTFALLCKCVCLSSWTCSVKCTNVFVMHVHYTLLLNGTVCGSLFLSIMYMYILKLHLTCMMYNYVCIYLWIFHSTLRENKRPSREKESRRDEKGHSNEVSEIQYWVMDGKLQILLFSYCSSEDTVESINKSQEGGPAVCLMRILHK